MLIGGDAAPLGRFATGGVDTDAAALALARATLVGVTAMFFIGVVGGFRCRRPLLWLHFSNGFSRHRSL